MDAHTRKTLEAITGGRAPRELDWKKFETFWRNVADSVENESGDRLAVTLNGHRSVFHRPHDARVTMAEIEQARHLLNEAAAPSATPDLLVLVMDQERTRFVELGAPGSGWRRELEQVENDDHRARRLRTVERRSTKHDEVTLDPYFDAVALALVPAARNLPVVLLGHGAGASNIADLFLVRLESHHAQLVPLITASGEADLSTATLADIDEAARRIVEP
jgi:hypothetical protein